MSKFNYRVALASEVSADEMLETLEAAGYEVLEITAKAPSDRVTKGSTILAAIQREANRPDNETILTRAEIAEEAGATVGRVAEVVKEFGELDDVKNYVERVRTERAVVRTAKSAALALAKAEAKLAKQGLAGANEPAETEEVSEEDEQILMSV